MTIAALINYEQGGVPGTPGQAYLGVTGSAVTASNADDTDVDQWEWKLTDVPRGQNPDEDSALSVGTVISTVATANFTPDVPGPYQTYLKVTDVNGVTRTHTNTFLVADEFGVLKPAFLSVATQLKLGHAIDRGWAYLMETLYSLVRKMAQHGTVRRDDYQIVSGNHDVDATTFTGVGSVYLDPSDLPAAGKAGVTRTITFEALIWATAGMTAEVRLWNLDTGTEVTGTVMSTTATDPTRKVSGTLAVPAPIPNSGQRYEVQIRISAGTPGPSDRAFCSMAKLVVNWE